MEIKPTVEAAIKDTSAVLGYIGKSLIHAPIHAINALVPHPELPQVQEPQERGEG